MSDPNNLQVPRGTHDLLPEQEPFWRMIKRTIEERADRFGFDHIETPMFEAETVFRRAIGEGTDIVEKEMFEVRRVGVGDQETDGQKLILRPEGTAGVARAFIEHGLHTWPQPVKLWYTGSFFRAERPQKGRYREFRQAGFELFGDDHPAADALLIYLLWQILADLKLSQNLVVDINSMGCPSCRAKFKKALVGYFQPLAKKLCPNCQRRLEKQPLRLLDCKEENDQKLAKDAPQIVDYLDAACRDHFTTVLESLDELQVRYDLKPELVRGLDYYTRTTFEVRTTQDNRRQNALGGGGRYDQLVELLGGQATPAIGFALGLDRILELMVLQQITPPAIPKPDLFVIQLGERAKKTCFSVVAKLGQEGFSAICQPGKDRLKDQLRLADKAGAKYALIIGQREALDRTVILRNMEEGSQETISHDDLVINLKARL